MKLLGRIKVFWKSIRCYLHFEVYLNETNMFQTWFFPRSCVKSIDVKSYIKCYLYNLFTRCTSMKCGFQTTNGASEQVVLQKFDTVPFYCVINKCQMRTSDKLEKCVRSVRLLCSICRNLYRTKIAVKIDFWFHLNKTAAKLYRLLL